MASPIELIVGLGNPGSQYQDTRHNAGEWFVEQLAKNAGITLKAESKFHGKAGRGFVAGRNVWLLIPDTFMNNSGKAVAALAQFYKIEPQSILVAHDELDIAPGTARLKFDGGHGGHNGLRDIVSCMGNRKDFARVRIGIGHPGHASQVTNYVLGKPPIGDRAAIDQAIAATANVMDAMLKGDIDSAMRDLHGFNAGE